jgi:hypothetical protein
MLRLTVVDKIVRSAPTVDRFTSVLMALLVGLFQFCCSMGWIDEHDSPRPKRRWHHWIGYAHLLSQPCRGVKLIDCDSDHTNIAVNMMFASVSSVRMEMTTPGGCPMRHDPSAGEKLEMDLQRPSIVRAKKPRVLAVMKKSHTGSRIRRTYGARIAWLRSMRK